MALINQEPDGWGEIIGDLRELARLAGWLAGWLVILANVREGEGVILSAWRPAGVVCIRSRWW